MVISQTKIQEILSHHPFCDLLIRPAEDFLLQRGVIAESEAVNVMKTFLTEYLFNIL